MPSFSTAQLSALRQAACALSFTAPRETVRDFAVRKLSLTPLQEAQLFGGLKNNEAVLTDALSKERDRMLAESGTIPPYAVVVDRGRPLEISGLGPALAARGAEPKLVVRLSHHSAIRTALVRLAQGHHLEAVAAAILASACDYGVATRGSGDQGVDAIGWKRFLPILPELAPRPHRNTLLPPFAWERVVVVASSKAQMAAARGKRKLISPAHFRELVGNWMIQRSAIGSWGGQGILPLSPIHLVMVTSYKVSAVARAECRELGLQIWSLPELVYLICEYGPSDLFPPGGTGTFDSRAFGRWWRAKHTTRIDGN